MLTPSFTYIGMALNILVPDNFLNAKPVKDPYIANNHLYLITFTDIFGTILCNLRLILLYLIV